MVAMDVNDEILTDSEIKEEGAEEAIPEDPFSTAELVASETWQNGQKVIILSGSQVLESPVAPQRYGSNK